MIKKLYKKHEEIILYIIVGVATTLVYFITRFSVLKTGTSSETAVIIAQITAILFAFITNKLIVFKSKTNSLSELIKQMVTFFAARGLSFLIDLSITYFCVTRFGDFFIKIFMLNKINYEKGLFSFDLVRNYISSAKLLNEFIFAFISQIVILVTNYILSKLIIFKKKKEQQ